MGDFILTLPAIRLLRESIPHVHLEVQGYAPVIALAQEAGLAEAIRSLLPWLLLAGCAPEGQPVTIDGSSPERFATTSAAAREQLSPEDRLAFDQALASVGNRRLAADPEQLRRTTFDGMTGPQVAEDFRRRSR